MVEDSYINTTFGAALMGLVVGSVLYGLTCMQTYLYYRTYSNDPVGLKLFIFALWLLDSTHMILSTTTIYWYLILNFNNPANLDMGYWAMSLQTDCNGLIGLMVELFFAWRVWKFSKSLWLVGIIAILALVHFTLGSLWIPREDFTVEGFRLGRYSRYSELTWVTCVGLGSAAACDMTIAISLVYYLLRSRTGFKQSDSVISTLVIYAINTGLFTSVCAAAATICVSSPTQFPLADVLTKPYNLCFISVPCRQTSFGWPSFGAWENGQVYVNSLLASLNSRQTLRRLAVKQEVRASVALPRFSTCLDSDRPRRGKTRNSSNGSIPGPFSPIEIVVDTTREQKSDYDDISNTNLVGSSDKVHATTGISESESSVASATLCAD